MTAIQQVTSDLSSVFGHTEPRIFTQPLRDLSDPDSTYGYRVIKFAEEILGTPLDPWQQFLVIHMGEYKEDNQTPRFEIVGVMVGRQQGKTFLLRVLSLFWQFEEKWPEILGTHTSQTYAKEEMLKSVEMARGVSALDVEIDKVLEGNNNIYSLTKSGSRYRAAAANSRAGRGKSLDRAIIDEVQKHKDWNTYNAAIPAMIARPLSQAVMTGTGGEEQSVVLNSIRATAIEFIETGSGDDSLGWFEWSAPDYADITDPQTWARAMPNLGYRVPVRKIRSRALTALTGPAEEVSFRTEYLCIQVRTLDAAVDAARWDKSYVPGNLADYRDRLAVALDVSPDGLHATLVASAIEHDGVARVDFLREWEGADLLGQVTNDLPNMLTKYKPVVFGWYSGGPASALSTLLKERKGVRNSIPAGVRVVEIAGSDVFDACEGFAAEVSSMQIRHDNDPLLNAHVTGAEKLHQGDRWRLQRNGRGHVDGAYAAAASVLLARTMPQRRSVTLIGPDDEEED